MISPTRKELIQKLIRFDAPLDYILPALLSFGWDCDEPLVVLDVESVVSILDRYLSGELSTADVEAWADAIECREDIDGARLKEIVFGLASPSITRRLTPEVAQDLKRQLESYAG